MVVCGENISSQATSCYYALSPHDDTWAWKWLSVVRSEMAGGSPAGMVWRICLGADSFALGLSLPTVAPG